MIIVKVFSWFKPQVAMSRLIQSRSLTRVHFGLIALLSFFYLIHGTLLISSIDTLPPFPFPEGKKIEAFIGLYFLIFTALYTFIQFFILLVWKLANILRGKGNLKETRMAFVWWLIVTAPLGFFWLMFVYTYTHPNAPEAKIIDGLALVGSLFFLIYGFFAILKCLAKVHQFSILKAFTVLILTTITLAIPIILMIL